jgi:hypothetical protein
MIRIDEVGGRGSTLVTGGTLHTIFRSVSFQFDLTSVGAVEPVIVLVPPTQSSFLQRAWQAELLLSGFSAHDIAPIHSTMLRADGSIIYGLVPV